MNIAFPPRLSRVITLLERKDILLLKLSVIAIFTVFGISKWFEFEVQALAPIILPTWLNIFNKLLGLHGTSYFPGVVEMATLLLLLGGLKYPALGAAGAALVTLTCLVTLSLLPQLGMLDSFIFKDLVIGAAGVVMLKADLVRWRQQG